jgi:hypothetical protein
VYTVLTCISINVIYPPILLEPKNNEKEANSYLVATYCLSAPDNDPISWKYSRRGGGKGKRALGIALLHHLVASPIARRAVAILFIRVADLDSNSTALNCSTKRQRPCGHLGLCL